MSGTSVIRADRLTYKDLTDISANSLNHFLATKDPDELRKIADCLSLIAVKLGYRFEWQLEQTVNDKGDKL